MTPPLASTKMTRLTPQFFLKATTVIVVAFSVLIGTLSGASGSGSSGGYLSPESTIEFSTPLGEIDKFKHGDYLKQLGDEIGLTDAGWRIFTSINTIEIVDKLVGCGKYSGGGCYVYNFLWLDDSHYHIGIESIEIEHVSYLNDLKFTLMHELLYAIYYRIPTDQRLALNSDLLEIYKKYKVQIDDLFWGYHFTKGVLPDVKMLNELHSMIPAVHGIEVTQLLYDHYTTYFDDSAMGIDANDIINDPSPSKEQQNSPAEQYRFKGWPIEELLDRDYLIASQEDLLNNYRCIYNVDTQIVPGGCGRNRSSDKSSHPGARDIDRNAIPETVPQAEINARDQLISNQENLLNIYRCRFNVDTQLVPSGCS